MIRVNLLREGPPVAWKSETPIDFGTSDETRDLITKIAIFIIPLVLVSGYRQYAITMAENELKSLEVRSADLKKQLADMEPVIKELDKFEEEKRKLVSQLEVIKHLSKERLLNVKSLDALQSLIPSKAWLTSLKINEKKVELEGRAATDLVVSDFLQALSSSIYFVNVTLVSSEESKHADGVVKAFKIKCDLENL